MRVCTHGDKNLHAHPISKALQLTCLMDRSLSGTLIKLHMYFYVGDLFCIHLGTKYANFLEKIFAEISGKSSIFQTFHCSNVTTMKLY